MTYFGENIKFRRVVTSLSVIYRAEIHLAHSLVITNNRKISRNRFCKIECSYIHEKRETCLFVTVQGLVSPYVVTYRFWLNKITQYFGNSFILTVCVSSIPNLLLENVHKAVKIV